MTMVNNIHSNYSERTHRAGGLLLMLSGVITATTSLAMLVVAGDGKVSVPANRIAEFDALFEGLLGVEKLFSSFIYTVPPWVIAAVAAFSLVISVLLLLGGASSYRGKNWYASMTTGVLGLTVLHTFPLTIVAVILISLAEGRFD